MNSSTWASWRTLIAGILLGVGLPLSTNGVGIYQKIGAALASIGGVIMGLVARDDKVTSEQSGAKPSA